MRNQRAERIRDRLNDNGAAHLATVDGPNDSTLIFYQIGKNVVILQEFTNNHGVTLYVEAPAATLEALEAYIDRLASP